MRSPRRVTITPTFWPSRSLNWAIDLRAFLISGFWPVMMLTSRTVASSALALAIASPTPTLTLTLATLGTCIGLE